MHRKSIESRVWYECGGLGFIMDELETHFLWRFFTNTQQIETTKHLFRIRFVSESPNLVFWPTWSWTSCSHSGLDDPNSNHCINILNF